MSFDFGLDREKVLWDRDEVPVRPVLGRRFRRRARVSTDSSGSICDTRVREP